MRRIKRGAGAAPTLARVSVTRRRWIAALAAALLLFAQFSATAHACVRAALAPAASGHCAEHAPADDLGATLACKAHCEPGSPNASPAPAADAPASPPLLAVLDWSATARLATEPARRLVAALSGAPPPGAAPLYLALLVLRN